LRRVGRWGWIRIKRMRVDFEEEGEGLHNEMALRSDALDG
jgi:hypothetical protein